MIILILLSITVESVIPDLWIGKSFIFYLFIAFIEFATLLLASQLKHELRSLILYTLLISVSLHGVWSVHEYLAMLSSSSTLLWDIGFHINYSDRFDGFRFLALLITIIELLVLFTPTLLRLIDGILRDYPVSHADRLGGYFNSKGVFCREGKVFTTEGER